MNTFWTSLRHVHPFRLVGWGVILLVGVAVFVSPRGAYGDTPTYSCSSPNVVMVNPTDDLTGDNALYPGNTFTMGGYWNGSGTQPNCESSGWHWKLRWVYKLPSDGTFSSWKKMQKYGTPFTVPVNDVQAPEGGIVNKTVTARIPNGTLSQNYRVAIQAYATIDNFISFRESSFEYIHVSDYDSDTIQGEKGASSATLNQAQIQVWPGWPIPPSDCSMETCQAVAQGNTLCNDPGFTVPNLRCPTYDWDYQTVSSGVRWWSKGYFVDNSYPLPDSDGHGVIELNNGESFRRSMANDLPQPGNYYVVLRSGFSDTYTGSGVPSERLEFSIWRNIGGNDTKVQSYVQHRSANESGYAFEQCVTPEQFYMTPSDTIQLTAPASSVDLDTYRIATQKPTGIPDCDPPDFYSVPVISRISCRREGAAPFYNCGQMRFDDSIAEVRVECYDADGSNTIDQVTVSLDGLTTGNAFTTDATLVYSNNPAPAIFQTQGNISPPATIVSDTYTLTATCHAVEQTPPDGSDGSSDSQTAMWIVGEGVPPDISTIECQDGATGWGQCNSLGSDTQTITGVRALCTDLDTVPTSSPGWDASYTEAVPNNLVSTAVAEYNGMFYLFGGQTSISPVTASDAVWKLDPSSGTWTQVGALPGGGRFEHTATTVTDKIYVIGGSNGTSTLSRVDIYEPQSDTWTTSNPINPARSKHAATTVGGRIYVSGGIDSNGNVLNDLASLDPVSGFWSTQQPNPWLGVSDQVLVASGTELFSIGGNRGGNPDYDQCNNLDTYCYEPAHVGSGMCTVWNNSLAWCTCDEIETYCASHPSDPECVTWTQPSCRLELPDATTNQVNKFLIDQGIWETVANDGNASAPYVRGSAGIAQDGTIYLFGGRDEDGDPIDTTHSYKPDLTWDDPSPPEAMPQIRFGHATAKAGGYAYVFGGNDGTGFVSEVERFSLGQPPDDDVESVKFTLSQSDLTSPFFSNKAAAYDEPSGTWQYLFSGIPLESDYYSLFATCTDETGFTDQDIAFWWVTGENLYDPIIRGMTPNVGYNDDSAFDIVDINGEDFAPSPTVELHVSNTTTAVATLTDITVEGEFSTDMHMSGTFDLLGVPADTYDLFVSNGVDNQGTPLEDTLENAFEVRDPFSPSDVYQPVLASMNGTWAAPQETSNPSVTLSWSFADPFPTIAYSVVLEQRVGGVWNDVSSSYGSGGMTLGSLGSFAPPGLPLGEYRWRIKFLDSEARETPWSSRDVLSNSGTIDPVYIEGDAGTMNNDPIAITSVLTHPTDPNIMIVGMADPAHVDCTRSDSWGPGWDGPQITTDGGTTWSPMNQGLVVSGDAGYCAGDIAMDPDDPRHLIMGTLVDHPQNLYTGNLFEINDYIDSWQSLLVPGDPGYNEDIVRVEISPIDSNIVFYAYTSDARDEQTAITWMRLDKGAHTFITLPSSPGQYFYENIAFNTTGITSVDTFRSSGGFIKGGMLNGRAWFADWYVKDAMEAAMTATDLLPTDLNFGGIGALAVSPIDPGDGINLYIGTVPLDPTFSNTDKAGKLFLCDLNFSDFSVSCQLLHILNNISTENNAAPSPVGLVANPWKDQNTLFALVGGRGNVDHNGSAVTIGTVDGVVKEYLDGAEQNEYQAVDGAYSDGLFYLGGWWYGTTPSNLFKYDDTWGYFSVIEAPAPAIYSITPNYAWADDGSVAVTIKGENFQNGVCPSTGLVQLQLVSSSQTILIDSCTRVDSTTITGRVNDLTTFAQYVAYDLLVQNPDTQNVTLPNAFTVFGSSNLLGAAWAGATDPHDDDGTPPFGCSSGGGTIPCATPGWMKVGSENGDYGASFEREDPSTFNITGGGWFGNTQTTDGVPLGWLDYGLSPQYDNDIPTTDLVGTPLSSPARSAYLDINSGQVDGWGRIIALADEGRKLACREGTTTFVDTGSLQVEGDINWNVISIIDASQDANGDDIADSCFWNASNNMCADDTVPDGNCAGGGWLGTVCSNSSAWTNGRCEQVPATSPGPVYTGCLLYSNATSFTTKIPDDALTGNFDSNENYYLTVRANYNSGIGEALEDIDVVINNGIEDRLLQVKDQNNTDPVGINLETCSFNDSHTMFHLAETGNTITFSNPNNTSVDPDWYEITNFPAGYNDCTITDGT